MSQCPFHQKLRPELPPLTPRLAKLPIDERGYPVPYFVMYIDGKPDFRVADGRKFAKCFKESLCWVCGEPLGIFKTFTIGPMCAVNRTTMELPEHLDCAEWSVKGCPFLSKPQMVRREGAKAENLLAPEDMPGIMIDRNPGVMCVWTTKSFKRFPDDKGKLLVEVGDPTSVSWWREGRPATLPEVLDSVESGLPLLLQECRSESDAEALRKAVKRAAQYWPRL